MSLTKYYVFEGMRQGAKNRKQRQALEKATKINFFQKRIDRNITILSNLDQASNPVLFTQIKNAVNNDNDRLEELIGIKKVAPPSKSDKDGKKDASPIIADLGKKKDVDKAMGTGVIGALNRNLGWVPDPAVVLPAVAKDVIKFGLTKIGLDDEAADIKKEIAEKFQSEVKQFKEDPRQFFKDIPKGYMKYLGSPSAKFIRSGTTDAVQYGSEFIDDIFNFGPKQLPNNPTIIAKEKTEDDQGNPLPVLREIGAYGEYVKRLFD